MSFTVSRIDRTDSRTMKQIMDLLNEQDLRFDRSIDETYAVFDDNDSIAATGSIAGNTLRCIAVSANAKGEGLAGTLISALLERQYERGNTHVFLYTKPSSAVYFRDLGFYEIVRTEHTVFMENRRTGFRDYLNKLAAYKKDGTSAAVVMNANPFTLGHLHLVRTAVEQYDHVHLFVLSEESGPIPFKVRKQLVEAGISGLQNVILHESGPYIISQATFPSYFQKDEENVILSQASVDVSVFAAIASVLGITARFVAEEPFSRTTALYNEVLQKRLQDYGIRCIVIPRLKNSHGSISASTVRSLIKEGSMTALKEYLPPSVYAYFMSDEAAPVIRSIHDSDDVIHH